MMQVRPHLFMLLVSLALLGFARGSLAGDVFVKGMEDMPLMPGLMQLPERDVVFDAPSGRIVEAYAEGSVTREAVRGFYARTLPQLGWRAAGADRYVREGETLRLEFPASRPGGRGDRLVVRFFLAPG